jgi:DNA-binding GntR family transcriptional regulator
MFAQHSTAGAVIVMSAKSGGVVQVPRYSDQIYRVLRNELESGLIAPGERVTETDLAARFGVSRTPVREAFMQLRREGLIASGRARGCASIARGGEPTRRFQRQEARAVIEGALAHLAACRADPKQRRALRLALEGARAAHERTKPAAFAQACCKFRALVRVAADNESLAQFVDALDRQEAPHDHWRSHEWRADEVARLAGLLDAVLGGAARDGRLTA